jgi:hypothetical protein
VPPLQQDWRHYVRDLVTGTATDDQTSNLIGSDTLSSFQAGGFDIELDSFTRASPRSACATRRHPIMTRHACCLAVLAWLTTGSIACSGGDGGANHGSDGGGGLGDAATPDGATGPAAVMLLTGLGIQEPSEYLPTEFSYVVSQRLAMTMVVTLSSVGPSTTSVVTFCHADATDTADTYVCRASPPPVSMQMAIGPDSSISTTIPVEVAVEGSVPLALVGLYFYGGALLPSEDNGAGVPRGQMYGGFSANLRVSDLCDGQISGGGVCESASLLDLMDGPADGACGQDGSADLVACTASADGDGHYLPDTTVGGNPAYSVSGGFDMVGALLE